jgi:hypothetical protein
VLDESNNDAFQNISMGELSFDDKLKFDFDFDPTRDKKLLAKRARKYFSDDMVLFIKLDFYLSYFKGDDEVLVSALSLFL